MSIYRTIRSDVYCDSCGKFLCKLSFDAKNTDLLINEHTKVTCKDCLVPADLEPTKRTSSEQL